jgi:hypothetical protein
MVLTKSELVTALQNEVRILPRHDESLGGHGRARIGGELALASN